MARQATLFMHIHKTAGVALTKQICDRLPGDRVCPEHFEWRVRDLPLETLQRYSFFRGHVGPAALSMAFSQLLVFTVLRAPRERLLSCFFYWSKGSRSAGGKFFDAMSKLSLIEFLRSNDPIIRRATWNVQARLLAGGQFGGVDEQRQNVFGPWLPEPDLADAAIHALARFAFVGVSERYELTLRRAYALMTLGEPPPPERINVTSSRAVSYDELLAIPDVADALSELTGADQVVYDAVCRRLDSQPPEGCCVQS
jgi:hypothetical protein